MFRTSNARRSKSRTDVLVGAALAAIVVLSTAVGAQAQGPDVRNIRPAIVLMMDSSGSMERLGDCVCTTTACEECLPQCGGGVYERNRWATVVEAMTGTFDTFSCSVDDRSGHVGEYDENYYIPHYELPVGISTQQDNGILDVYIDRVRFGLMTFDGVSTLTSAEQLVATTAWNAGYIAQSEGTSGMFSYGERRPFNFPGCATDYMIDNGARSDTPPGGAGAGYEPGNMVSVGTDAEDHTLINQEIQDSLLNVRPFGPTPIAGMLDDVRYYFDNHEDVRPIPAAGASGDPYAACRSRYLIMLTDGYPNADMREDPFNCDTVGFTCPYDRPEEITADLCAYDASLGECSGKIDGMFVVGFNIADPAAVARLNDLAAIGGTDAALFADDGASLRSALAEAIDRAAPGTTTRTVPAFSAATGGRGQYQFNTGFNVSEAAGDPWTGVLERRRFECDGVTVVERPIEDEDRFHVQLAGMASASRNLYTVPEGAGTWFKGNGEARIEPPSIRRATDASTGTSVSGTTASSLTQFHRDHLSPSDLGLTGTTERDAALAWVRAESHASVPTERVDNPLADIYHSSPIVVAAPSIDAPDEDYNLFRESIANRPTMVVVGTNDGILHSFAAEDYDVDGDGTDDVTAGEELWGFIPPVLLDKLDDAAASHQWMVDGTPVVQDVFFARLPGDAPNDERYRTVLVTGLRGGGDAWLALDITDYERPEFLWQLTDARLGNAFGEAALGQVLIKPNSLPLHERAIAIIPGGRGSLSGPGACPAVGVALPDVTAGTSTRRTDRRCWDLEGRSLFVVDVASGDVLADWDSTDGINAPMTGAVSLFTGDVGTIATRAFVTDADGVLWRLDLSDPNPSNWELEAFHDIFYDAAYDEGQPAYYAPVLTTDGNGNVVVIQATGEIDLLDATSANRVVSISERVTFSGTGGVDDVGAALNWEVKLNSGEQVTGPIDLFDGRVYFGSFRSEVSLTDACSYGYSRLWGVDYLDSESGSDLPEPGIEDSSGTLVRFLGPYTNQIIMGVAVTQRPNCYEGEVDIDPYLGSRYRVTNQGGGGFQLVAQVGGGGTVAAGGTVGEITRDLTPPIVHTEVVGWAGAVD